MKLIPWLIIVATCCVLTWFGTDIILRAFVDLHSISLDIHDIRDALCPVRPAVEFRPKREKEAEEIDL